MNRDMNGNMEKMGHAGCLMFQRKFMPEIYAEHRRNCMGHNDARVPDTQINLECDEVIDDWDHIETFDALSPEKNPHVSIVLDSDSIDSFCDYPPPNSPAEEDAVDSLNNSFPQIQSRYVTSLLQIWRESHVKTAEELHSLPVVVADETGHSDDDTVDDTSDDEKEAGHESMSFPSEESATESFSQESERSENSAIQDSEYYEGSHEHSILQTNIHSFHDGDHLMSVIHEPPSPIGSSVSSNSSRASSPEIVQALSPSIVRMSFDHLRSISPRIERSPSPFDSRPSSPRVLRSPSPLDHLSDLSDSLVFYEERFLVRSTSPFQRGTDHQVPDVDSEFQQIVAHSHEFPSPRAHHRQRLMNSCNDQVVPEWIEE